MSFFDDDISKRYYSPSNEPDEDETEVSADLGHYYSPLDEPVEDEEVLPFSHVDFDDETDGETDGEFNADSDDDANEQSDADDTAYVDYDGDYTDKPIEDDYSEPEEFEESEIIEELEEPDKTEEIGSVYEDRYYSSEDEDAKDAEYSGEDEYNGYNDFKDVEHDMDADDNSEQEFYKDPLKEEPAEEFIENDDINEPYGGQDTVFDKKNEYLFNDEYPEEPESLGRQKYSGADDQVRGQMSFYDFEPVANDGDYLVKEDFFEHSRKKQDNVEMTAENVSEDYAEGKKAEDFIAEPKKDVVGGVENEPISESADIKKPASAFIPPVSIKENNAEKKQKEDLRSKYMFIEDENPNVAKIMVIGVGGAGNNAVNRMIETKVNTATFVAMNTDRQALIRSKCPIENRYQIGVLETKGLGAGSDPEIGERAAEESRELIEQLVDGVDLLFIAAGMGGGTGTGAAPVIAKIAKDKGCVTVAVVTKPFNIEGRKRAINAEKGIANLKKYVDTIIIIPNDKLLEALRPDTPLVDALLFADDTLRQGICGIADIIATNALINLDFADVRTVLKDQGLAHMGIGRAKGENRVMEAVKDAVTSPLLETTIEGARGIILNVTGGKDMTIGQVYEASRQVQNIVDPSANIILGMNIDEKLQEELVITLIATGFDHADDEETTEARETAQERAYKNLFMQRPVQEPAAPEIVEIREEPKIEPQEEPEEIKPPKKELPPFMRKLFKK